MKRQAFTLVELIVVITILAVLGTIAFVSFQWYSQSARDSVRISDLKNIQKALTFHFIESNNYPVPTSPENITFSWSTVWQQGTVWENVIQKLRRLTSIPVDPLTGTQYAYSVTHQGIEFQLWAVFEWDILAQSTLPQAHAGDRLAYSYVRGQYNGKIIHITIDNTLYVLAVPTIISWDLSIADLQQLINEWKLVVAGQANLPASYSGSVYNTLGWWNLNIVNPWKLVAFSWSISDLTGWSQGIKIDFIKNLQAAYSWTVSKNSNGSITQLMSIDTSDTLSTQIFANTIVQNDLWQQVTAISNGWSNGGTNGFVNNYKMCEIWYGAHTYNFWKPFSGNSTPIYYSTLAMKVDGTVKTWWSSWSSGWAPTGSWYVKVFNNNSAWAAMKANGSITSWWSSANGGTGEPTGSGYTSITSTEQAFAALHQDGTIFVWWNNGYGWDTTNPPAGTFLKIYGNERAFAGMKSDGSITTWWSTSFWGTGGPTDTWYADIFPTRIGFLAIKTNGDIFMWWASSMYISTANLAGYKSVVANNGTFSILKDDGSIHYIKDNTVPLSHTWFVKIFTGNDLFAGLKDTGELYLWWENTYGWAFRYYLDGSDYKDVVSTWAFFSALKNDGTMVTWKQRGTSWSYISPYSTFHSIHSDGPFKKMAASGYAFAALREDGSVKVWWHEYNYGAYGGNQAQAPAWNGYVDIYATQWWFTVVHQDGTIKSWWNFAGTPPTDTDFVSINGWLDCRIPGK